uniref:Lactamase_B domain-containing protein n=1 Tax=Caenorhabditis tropicalis TaxID=1561998 RepID=A0A1I7T0F9_9PELO
MSTCRGAAREICVLSFALRTAIGEDGLDLYLCGDLTPGRMASIIIHNNEHHKGCTYAQLGHAIRIMEARTITLGHTFEKDLIKRTEALVDEYNYAKYEKRVRAINASVNLVRPVYMNRVPVVQPVAPPVPEPVENPEDCIPDDPEHF